MSGSAATGSRPADKVELSHKRRRPVRETHDVAAGAARQIRAIGKRVADEDPADLALLLELDEQLRLAWEDAIVGLRQTGYSDSEIGGVLGTTKQAVQQRWPRGS